MRDKITALGLALLLAGCAASGPTGDSTLSAGVNSGTARLVIYRSNSPLGAAVQPSYVINGHSVASSTPNGFVACDLRPGRYQVSVANMSLNVNLTGGTDNIWVALKAGTTTFVRAQPAMGLTIGVITLAPISAQQGRAETASLHRLEASCPR